MITMTTTRPLGGLAFVALVAAACNTQVTNPGPIQDQFLADSAAFPAMVNGAGRGLAQAINWIGYTSAAVTREIHPAGSTGSFGITPQWQAGILDKDDTGLGTHWNEGQRARWLAENAVERMGSTGSATLRGRALLWAGFSNRLLGDNMCDAVFDGSAAQPNAEYFRRAEQWFTQASQVATGTDRTAALAGRASARVHLGDWTGAVADAQQVATDFNFAIPYYNIGEDAQRNRIQWAVHNTPYRAHTQWNTVYESYYETTNDQRVRWTRTTLEGDAAIGCCGRVPFYPQAKYADPAAAIRLASGREMRLIEAEARLRADDWQGAIERINAIRLAAGAPAVTAANATEAWTHLKRERGIELWLEGRRMGDMRRWRQANTPGEHHPLEIPSAVSHLTQQDLCFPTPLSERETNPNIPV